MSKLMIETSCIPLKEECEKEEILAKVTEICDRLTENTAGLFAELIFDEDLEETYIVLSTFGVLSEDEVFEALEAIRPFTSDGARILCCDEDLSHCRFEKTNGKWEKIDDVQPHGNGVPFIMEGLKALLSNQELTDSYGDLIYGTVGHTET